jgi:hypothetical protein
MNNVDKIRKMTDVELASFLCDIVQDVAIKADLSDACKCCPVNKMCRAGKNGFVFYLQTNEEDN